MRPIRSVLDFLGLSVATNRSGVPIKSLKDRFFKPGESQDFDDLLRTAISLGVTISVDPAALERERLDGSYSPVKNNIVLRAIPDRTKPEFYDQMTALNHELYHASKYKLVLRQNTTERSRRASLSAGAKEMKEDQFINDNLEREWAAQNNALLFVREAAIKDPHAPKRFKKLNIDSEVKRYMKRNLLAYKIRFRERYNDWTGKTGETVPEMPTVPIRKSPRPAPRPAPTDKSRQRRGGRTGWLDYGDPVRRIREEVAANERRLSDQRRRDETIARNTRRIRTMTENVLAEQRRIVTRNPAGWSNYNKSVGIPQFAYGPSFISQPSRGYSGSSNSSDWWKRQRFGTSVANTPQLPGYTRTFQHRPGYAGGMFANIFKPASPAPWGVRYPWDSAGRRWHYEPRTRTFD